MNPSHRDVSITYLAANLHWWLIDKQDVAGPAAYRQDPCILPGSGQVSHREQVLVLYLTGRLYSNLRELSVILQFLGGGTSRYSEYMYKIQVTRVLYKVQVPTSVY